MNGALTTGGATYAIERWFNKEPDAMKLALAGAACHVGGNLVASRFGSSPHTGTIVSAGIYSFAAPRVAQVNQPDAYMTRFLTSVGANIAGKAAGNTVSQLVGRYTSTTHQAASSLLGTDSM